MKEIKTFEEVKMNNIIVNNGLEIGEINILKREKSLENIIIILVNLQNELMEKIKQLESISPFKIKDFKNKTIIYRTPNESVLFRQMWSNK